MFHCCDTHFFTINYIIFMHFAEANAGEAAAMADGDARGLEEQAAAAAEAARELRDAAAAFAVRRAADEDALRRRAVALDGDLRRLQGSLAALEPAALDKVRPPRHRPLSPSPSSLYIGLIRIRSLLPWPRRAAALGRTGVRDASSD